MKKELLYVFCICALVACSKEEYNAPSENKATLTAYVSQATKTSIDLSTYDVTWKDTDGITVCNGSKYADYTMTSLSENKKCAKFTGDDLGNGKLLAVYGDVLLKSGSRIDVDIPAKQEYVANGIKEGYLPMYATGTADGGLQFTYTTGIFSFSLYDAGGEGITIKKVYLNKTSYDHSIAGGWYFKRENDGSVTTGALANIFALSLALPSGGVMLGTSSETATNFNFVLMGGSTLDSGVTVVVVDSNDKVMSLRLKKTYSLTAGTVLKFKPVAFSGEPETVFLVDPDSNEIPLCAIQGTVPVENNLIYKVIVKTPEKLLSTLNIQAIQAWTQSLKKTVGLDFSDVNVTNNSWSGRFYNVSYIKYPTSLKTISGAGNASLKTAILPEGLTTISDSAFDGATGLTLEVPSSVTSIREAAVNVCKSVTIAEGNQYFHINNGGLYYTNGATKKLVGYLVGSGIEDFVIEDNTTAIETYAFCHANGKLKSIDIPSTVTSIGRLIFFDTASIHTVKCRAANAPASASSPFMNGGISGSYYKSGESLTHALKVFVPADATGYETTLPWKDLFDENKQGICKYTLVKGDMVAASNACISPILTSEISSSEPYWN